MPVSSLATNTSTHEFLAYVKLFVRAILCLDCPRTRLFAYETMIKRARARRRVSLIERANKGAWKWPIPMIVVTFRRERRCFFETLAYLRRGTRGPRRVINDPEGNLLGVQPTFLPLP